MEMYLGCLDSDGDGVADLLINFREPSQWDDSDGDGYGDNPDGINADDCVNVSGTSNELGLLGCLDTDNDGYGDILDAFLMKRHNGQIRIMTDMEIMKMG